MTTLCTPSPVRHEHRYEQGTTLTRRSLILAVTTPGHRLRWDEFVAAYQPLLQNYVRKQGVPLDDVADVIQDVFFRLWRKLPGFVFDHGRSRFRTWLWKVVERATIDWHRRRGQQPHRELLEPGDHADHRQEERAWEGHSTLQAKREALASALARVRRDCKAEAWICFQEHVLHGKPAAEVADQLGVTANVVFVRSSRVLAKVRQHSRARLKAVEHA